MPLSGDKRSFWPCFFRVIHPILGRLMQTEQLSHQPPAKRPILTARPRHRVALRCHSSIGWLFYSTLRDGDITTTPKV